jgi:hypothetical protein
LSESEVNKKEEQKSEKAQIFFQKFCLYLYFCCKKAAESQRFSGFLIELSPIFPNFRLDFGLKLR